MSFHRFIAGALLAFSSFVSFAAQAADFKTGAIIVADPRARATAPGQPTGGGFLTIRNQGGDDRLLSASAGVAQTVELHQMKMEGDVMHMRQVDAVALPAGQTVELKPGGYHLMLMGLKAPLKAGESFPLKLKFEKAGDLTVDVKIEAAGNAPAMTH